MDYRESTNTLTLSHPAYLFIGSPDTLLEHTIALLQQQFCQNIEQPAHPEEHDSASGRTQACSVCIQCRKIREQQHESVLWLCPEKQYAIDDLDVIFSTIAFALEQDHHFFFVLQKADMLTSTCANALLKSLEEPPAGYHFILLAQRHELILPTIKSRCFIEQLQSTDAEAHISPLLPFFTTTTFHDPLAFGKELESANPNEWESLALLDQLFIYWADVYKKSLIKKDESSAHGKQNRTKQAEKMMLHLKKAMQQPPMPGSSKLFWKNLFLQIKEL